MSAPEFVKVANAALSRAEGRWLAMSPRRRARIEAHIVRVKARARLAGNPIGLSMLVNAACRCPTNDFLQKLVQAGIHPQRATALFAPGLIIFTNADQ